MSNEIFNREVYQKGDCIFNEGDAAFHIFVVEVGEVEIVKKGANGMTKLAFLKKGDLFGEMALADNNPRSASAISISNCVCLRIPSMVFQEQLKICPPIVQGVLRVLVDNLRNNSLRNHKEKEELKTSETIMENDPIKDGEKV